jgi:hypothetical protein
MKDSHRKSSRKTRYLKLIRFIALIILAPLCMVLTTREALGRLPKPYTASLDGINGIALVNNRPALKGRLNGYDSGSKPDTLSVPQRSWVHLTLNSDPVVTPAQVGPDPTQNTDYTFACKMTRGTAVWGFLSNRGTCENGISVPMSKSGAGIKSQNPSILLASRLLTSRLLEKRQYIAQDIARQGNLILDQLISANIFYSVQKKDLIDWINSSDRRYWNVAEGCLNILQNQVLKDSAPNLDVIFYKYFILAGYADPIGSVDQIPQNPQIDQSILREAIKQSFNERNGTNFSSFEEIVEDEIIISPLTEKALFSVSNSKAQLKVEVLIGSVQVKNPNSSPRTVKAGERYVYSITGTQETVQIQIQEISQSEPFNTFLDPTLWSPEVSSFIKDFRATITPPPPPPSQVPPVVR